jgi:hypothetical protein
MVSHGHACPPPLNPHTMHYCATSATPPRKSRVLVVLCGVRRAQLGDHVRPTAPRIALATADSPARVAPVTAPTPCAGS